jgi:hypothetical protein
VVHVIIKASHVDNATNNGLVVQTKKEKTLFLCPRL